MACIIDTELNRLRTDDTFKSWLQKIKDQYPDKTDDEVERTLITFMELNNGNFPGYTPFGKIDDPQDSDTFEALVQFYGGDEVSAMEVYQQMFDDDFIETFGDWCNKGFDTEGLTDEQIEERNQENQIKLLKAVRNTKGEPALLFVNSVKHLSSKTSVEAVNRKDNNLPFKIVIENGEARAIVGYDRSVPSGSITFAVAKNVVNAISDVDEISLDVSDIAKSYDFESENKGFTDKRLTSFITQSSRDLYRISNAISKINRQLERKYDEVHNEEEVLNFIKNHKLGKNLVFDTDEMSPFGHIQLMSFTKRGKTIWQIASPNGIFLNSKRDIKAGTSIDDLIEKSFINAGLYKSIKNYIINTGIQLVKPDSYLSSPIIGYEGGNFILKPASNRTQHNIKTEFALAYSVFLFKKNPQRFNEYLNFAKQFKEIYYNSAGIDTLKEVNAVGNFIGFILSGQLVDDNYYTAHLFDRNAVEQAIFVSKHKKAIREIVGKLNVDIRTDIDAIEMDPMRNIVNDLYRAYSDLDFSDITDNLSKNRTASKLKEDDMFLGFCDSIDKVKTIYNYRRNDSGSKKQYDATEYTRIAATYEQLSMLNKQIKEYLLYRKGGDTTVSGENLEKLISQYFTCIETIVNIMDDDILKLEDFIVHPPKPYTPEYYSSLLYFDRSVIGMYKTWKTTVEALFTLDSNKSDAIQKTLYDIFSQKQVRKFDELRNRYYENYERLSGIKSFHDDKESIDSIIDKMIDDAISHICDDWCNKNIKCLTEREERIYRENLKLDLKGHIKAGMPADVAIGAASASGHSIINVLYRIIQTQGNRSNLLIKQKGDLLLKKFKSTFNNHSPFNQCKQFCEMIDGKTTGYFVRDVNYGQYYRAKVAKQRQLLNNLPKDDKGPLYYTIDEEKSTATKLFIEWHVGAEEYQTAFLDEMDRWIEQNANRRYNAQYYIDRRRILGKERDGIVVGNEAANRQNTLRRQIDAIKNRYREVIWIGDKKETVFLPSKIPPVQKKILENLEQQLQNLSSPYERYVNSDGTEGIRQKTGLDLAIALNIQEWNKYIQKKRKYGQDTERYNKIEKKLKSLIGSGIRKEDYDAFVSYYHRRQATQEYYDLLKEKFGEGYGEYQSDIDDIRFRRRSILARVKHGKKDILQQPNLNELNDSEWAELTRLDEEEDKIKSKLPARPNTTESITSHTPVTNEDTDESFINEHREKGTLHTYTGSDGEEKILSVYWISAPDDFDTMVEDVLVDEFSVESSDYGNNSFDPSNSSYEQPKMYDDKGKKLYKNDAYEKIKNDPKLFDLYNAFLDMMQEANQMFGYAAISSNYKLPQIYEREASVYVSRGCSLLNSLVYKLKRQYLIDERDLERSYTSDIHADNSHSGKLRKRFVEMLSDPEHISTDLVYSVMAYYTVACRYSDKQNIQAQCELIKRKIDHSSNEKFKKQVDNTLETFLFENTMNTDSAIAGAVEKFADHTTSVMLKWKLKTAIKAFLDGYRLLTNLALTNKWNLRGHFLYATNTALKQTFTSLRSSVDVLDYNLSEALMSLNNINIQSYIDANKTKFTRAFYRSGMMPMLTMIDHVTSKSILLAVYDSIRLYENPDGTKQFLNIDEFINMYKKHHPELNDKVAEKEAEDLFWGKKGNNVVTLINAYQLGKKDRHGNIIKGTENILSIKDEYLHMFSSDEEENQEQWDILQTRVQGQLNMIEATVNGFKPEDSKSGSIMRTWYLKPIFQIRSFLVANYNECFKHSDALRELVSDSTLRNTNTYIPKKPGESKNKTVNKINSFWDSDKRIVQMLNSLTSEREMYNVLTGSKDVGYYFGVLSYIRKQVENMIIYLHSSAKKGDPEFRHISNLEKLSVANMFIVLGEAMVAYNAAVFIGGLLCCLLGQGTSPDDEDEWFIHWFLWTLYDLAGSMLNEISVNFPTGETIVDIFRNIASMITSLESWKNTLLKSEDTGKFVWALLFGDGEEFENPEYGTNESPFNLIKSGKWQTEMYGKRYFYEAVQNSPWLIAPWYINAIAFPITIPISNALPDIPIANLKESFSAYSAEAKAGYTFNNLSPIDHFKLGTPSTTDESYEKFHDYGPGSSGAALLNSLMETAGISEEDVLEFIRDAGKNPYTPIPRMSPVDMAERQIPLGREYD